MFKSVNVCSGLIGNTMRLVAGVALAAGVMAGSAQAAPMEYTINSYTGNTSSLTISVEQTSATQLTFDLSQASDTLSGTVGELRAFFFSVADASLLTGASISGTDVTGSFFDFGALGQVPGENDTKINGGVCGGGGCLFDVAVVFGTTGLDNPAITSTSFTYTRAAGLSLDSFFATDGDIFGARMKSFTSGDGSSKLACRSVQDCPGSTSSSSSSGGPGGNEVPEPGMLAIFGLGLLGLGALSRRRQTV